MKKGRFLWSAHRITERQKAGKARSIKGKQLKNSRSTVSRLHVVLHSSQRDNLSRTKISRKAHFSRVTEVVECRQMCWNLHRMQHICSRYATKILICIGHFSVEILGNVLLRVSTSGATDSEYVEMMLASIETYLLDGIARQRDMSKIALQSANGTDCLSNSINRIYKLLNIKVGIYFLG